MQTIVAPPGLPGQGLAQSNPEKAIELLQAQIAGVKKEISDLTGQLTPGTSDAREEAISTQLESASERLNSLQGQLNQVISGDAFPTVAEPPIFPPSPDDIPQGVLNLAEMVLIAVVLVTLGLPIVRLVVRRLEPRAKVEPATDQAPRMERLEQAMDAVAIEVERVSEGQRFTNKVLSDIRALPAPNPLDQWVAGRAKAEERVSGERG